MIIFSSRPIVFLVELILFIGLVLFIFTNSIVVSASSLYNAYDLIYISHPASSTDHSLNFTIGKPVPPSGKIIVTFEGDGVNIPVGFNYLDVDFSVATTIDNFIDRDVNNTPSDLVDGITVNTGIAGIVTVDLSSTTGIFAGNQVKLEFGENATYGAVGDTQIVNASTTGEYWVDIKTYNASGGLIDRVRTFIVMIDPVSVSATVLRTRGNGLPTGTLEGGTTLTIMSLTTNFNANCSYSTVADTGYYDMSDVFYSFDGVYHTVLLTGLQSGGHYIYYVRCEDRNVAYIDNDDYIIEFYIASTGDGGTGGGTGGGSGGGSGSGSGVLKPYPLDVEKKPSVILDGWAYPGSRVTFLQDGEKIVEKTANGKAEFEFSIPSLNNGLYTFNIWATDSDGTKSSTYGSTFWVEENTQTNVSNIVLPPTISLVKESVEMGENLEFYGQSVPNDKIEIILYSPVSNFIVKNEETVSAAGRWISVFPTVLMEKGIYKAKAHTFHEGVGFSDYGRILDCGVGEKVETGPCVRSDLNKDGKINLVDFSILMFNWGDFIHY